MDKHSEEALGEGRHRPSPWAKAYSVFNLAQVDGYSPPADAFPRLDEAERIAQAEAFFARLPGLDLQHCGTATFYAPATDHVQLLAFADFRRRSATTAPSPMRRHTGPGTLPAWRATLPGASGQRPMRRKNWSPSWAPPSCWPTLALRLAAP